MVCEFHETAAMEETAFTHSLSSQGDNSYYFAHKATSQSFQLTDRCLDGTDCNF